MKLVMLAKPGATIENADDKHREHDVDSVFAASLRQRSFRFDHRIRALQLLVSSLGARVSTCAPALTVTPAIAAVADRLFCKLCARELRRRPGRFA